MSGSAARETTNLTTALPRLSDYRSPRSVATVNDYEIKVVKVQGEFVWHTHAGTDEFFLVLKGSLRIQMRDGAVTLGPGDLFVVPRGVEHCPVAEQETHILLLEPRGTVNTGDARP